MDQLSTPSEAPLQHILVCGSGLAARMTVAALSAQVPGHVRITWLKVPGTDACDILYGNVAPPSAYDFNLAIGLDERALLMAGGASFCFGTQYGNWGADRRTWVQASHAPFPVLNGVLFYHYVLRQGHNDLSPYLVSAEAATQGVFAHPPEDPRHPLSRAEFGYQFDPEAYGALFERLIPPSVIRTEAAVAGIRRDGETIAAIELVGGEALSADLYIDCTGPAALLGTPLDSGRSLSLLASRGTSADLGPALRTVTAGTYGWTAQTRVEGQVQRLTVYGPEDRDMALEAHGAAPSLEANFTLGHRAEAWTGNCVTIGQAAGVVEPVTPAPFLLLQRDIERLLSLLPVSHDIAVERREFNRQYADDYRHAAMFNRALFVAKAAPMGAYWQAATEAVVDEGLAAKLEQFESRGLHVAFDLEPFALEDWIILHFGMGRRPERYDRMADQMPPEALCQYLDRMKTDIARAVKAMPPHAVYRQGLVKYLQQQGA